VGQSSGKRRKKRTANAWKRGKKRKDTLTQRRKKGEEGGGVWGENGRGWKLNNRKGKGEEVTLGLLQTRKKEKKKKERRTSRDIMSPEKKA